MGYFFGPLGIFLESWAIFWTPWQNTSGVMGYFFGTPRIFFQESWAIFLDPYSQKVHTSAGGRGDGRTDGRAGGRVGGRAGGICIFTITVECYSLLSI